MEHSVLAMCILFDFDESVKQTKERDGQIDDDTLRAMEEHRDRGRAMSEGLDIDKILVGERIRNMESDDKVIFKSAKEVDCVIEYLKCRIQDPLIDDEDKKGFQKDIDTLTKARPNARNAMERIEDVLGIKL